MDTPLISVLIPAWNVERYLPECLDSILAQDERRIEVLVMDDGSTDGTAGLLARRAAADGRIRVFRQENAGAYVARNRLLDEAKGEWVYLCDADDKLAPGAFSRLLAVAGAEDLDAVFFSADVFYDSESLEERFPRFRKRYSFSRDFSAPRPGQDFFCDCMEAREWKGLLWLMLVRRDLIERNAIRFEEGAVHKDDIFTIDVALRARRAARIPDHLYFRRMREGSLMTTSHPLADFLNYVHNALWAIAAGGRDGLSPRTRGALGAIVLHLFRNAEKALGEMTEEEKERLEAEHPCENAVARLFSRTRMVEELHIREEALARRDAAIVSLRRDLAARKREIARLRSSRLYRLGKTLLDLPRRVAGRLLRRSRPAKAGSAARSSRGGS